jgi:Holliday junction resolvasome RuvABC endonuclease subunit
LRQIQDEIFFSLDSINDAPDEVKKLQETLEQILDRIRTMFSQITSRVYQIESNTFLNYKFKNVINLMQHLIEESYRMQVTELMP